MKHTLTIICAALILTGCASQSFIVNSETTDAPSVEASQTFWVSGIGQGKTVNAASACGGVAKVRKVESHQTVMDNVYSMLTFGIYTPRTAKIYCAK
jgi:uncharacterized lipoprotein YajG